jgi:hypothetical protein
MSIDLKSSIANPASGALRLALLQQVLTLPLAGLILDGGGVLLVWFFSLEWDFEAGSSSLLGDDTASTPSSTFFFFAGAFSCST